MSRWISGTWYRYYGAPIFCVRRYFDGPLEMVDLQLADAKASTADGLVVEPSVFTRTARALRPCIVPRITETLGGVCSPATCDHHQSRHVLADAGPYAGRLCCEWCGTPPEVKP